MVSLGYQTMMPIQEQALPHILAGKDIIAQAQTGSGKTITFGLGLLEKLNIKQFQVQALVLCPTRELANQVAQEIRKIARSIQNIKVITLCGGMPFGLQAQSLEKGVHIVVGTPGRINDHLIRQTLTLDAVNMLVLDEADCMLDMGFHDILEIIIEQTPKQRQTLLFSATFPEKIKDIAHNVMIKPITIQVESALDNSDIVQYFYQTDDRKRSIALQLLILHYQPQSALIFCNTKQDVKDMTQTLMHQGFSAQALHGDLEQYERDQTLIQFTNKSIAILVATDVAARGLDIDGVDLVINYQLARNADVHTHRIGRTGRAGNQGTACSLYDEREQGKIKQLEEAATLYKKDLPSSELLNQPSIQASMATLQIFAGKKQKIRAGDILGALTQNNTLAGNDVGKIIIANNWSYVAVHSQVAKIALKKLNEGKLKGRSFRVVLLHPINP